MNTEDDTFEALRRPSYDEMTEIVMNSSCVSTGQWDELFSKYHWTLWEYSKIRNKRDDELWMKYNEL